MCFYIYTLGNGLKLRQDNTFFCFSWCALLRHFLTVFYLATWTVGLPTWWCLWCGCCGRVPASLTGVFSRRGGLRCRFFRLPFGLCSALLQALWWMLSRRVFPFASPDPGASTRLDSVAFEAQCDSGCLVFRSLRDYWLLHFTLLLLLHGLLVI